MAFEIEARWPARSGSRSARDPPRETIRNKVNVKTRRGSVKLSVRQDRELPKGMIFIPFCFSEAAANKLTNPQLDPFGKIPEFKYCAANIEAC